MKPAPPPIPDRGDWQKTIRGVLTACADCDTCRFLMDDSCLLFPELYRLYDAQVERGQPATEEQLRRLSTLCTLCGLCPCPNIRIDVIRARAERARSVGMGLRDRLLADVQRFARLAGRASGLVNRLISLAPVRRLAAGAAGLHPDRRLPRLAGESFFAWARRKGLDRMPETAPKVAYFAGCTAGYFFPEVARAAVGVLQQNGVSVFVPDQQCCGMPTLLEGDLPTTLPRVRANLDSLLAAVQSGCDIVCSCPTCGFLLKMLLGEGACYSDAYQQSVGAGPDEIKIPDPGTGGNGFVRLKKSIYHRILTDNGCFAALDPLKRIALSQAVTDLGAYLGRLNNGGRVTSGYGRVGQRMVYYAPCHQREQGIGSPYLDLLKTIPGLHIAPVGGAMDCCGMGGSLGFKKDFHHASIRLGEPLMKKIAAADPEVIVTDCLSCRLQFRQMLPFDVRHPLEILARACRNGRHDKGAT